MKEYLKRLHRACARLASASAALLLSACAVLPHDVERTPSKAGVLTPSTQLGALVPEREVSEGFSGFRLLPSPDFAFDARVQLLTRAQQTLDVQYYEIADDQSGRNVLCRLRDAARRGVRVRLLIDDLHTTGEDTLLLGLAAEPGVEVRLFNPFPAARDSVGSRLLLSLFDVRRVNRRMHNKMMIADGAFAVVGGRNIGDEYFLRSASTTFLDLDVLASGALVPQLSDIFDRYWNADPSYPIEAIASSGLTLEERRQSFGEQACATVPEPVLPTTDFLDQRSLGEDLRQGTLNLVWGRANAIADDPDKALGHRVDSVRHRVRELVRRATREVVVTTPYLVPGPEGMETLRGMHERGVRVDILTNSLAAIDEPFAFVGYLRYRTDMLQLGAEIHEIAPSRVTQSHRLRHFADSSGRLHAKSVVIDRETVFIGSMNLDPRSETHNTEMGILISSPQIARQMLEVFDHVKRDGAYRVRLRDDGATEWLSDRQGDAALVEEPETRLWNRFLLRLLQPLVPEDLL